MVVAYVKLVGRKTPLPKEPEMKTPATNGRPPVVTATVGSWKASRYGRHKNTALTESLPIIVALAYCSQNNPLICIQSAE